MAGTTEGGKKAALTNEQRHDWKYEEGFYRHIGSLGGKKSKGGGFAYATPEQRKEWGRKGGMKSKRLRESYEN